MGWVIPACLVIVVHMRVDFLVCVFLSLLFEIVRSFIEFPCGSSVCSFRSVI